MRRHVVLWLLSLTLATAGPARAQQLDLSASVGAGNGSWRAAGGAAWSVGLRPWLRVGLGPRLSRFGGDAKPYRLKGDAPSAPSRLSLSPNVWALNLAVSAEVRPVRRLLLGGNLDLTGIAFGPERERAGLRVAPARWSLFRYGNQDLGSLNSEAYVGLHFTAVTVRVGMSHFVTGYRVRGPGSARYLRFDTVPFVALSWTP